MTSFDPARVEADIAMLNGAFTYDPPEQWLAAYQRLEQVDVYLTGAQHAFRWIFTIGIVAVLAAIVMWFAMPGWSERSSLQWSAWLIVVIATPDATFHLARWLAERREPLLKMQDRIKGQLAKFHDRADAHNGTKHHVPA